MLNELRKYLEYLFFILLNISLLSPMLKIYNFLGTLLFIKLINFLFNTSIFILDKNYYTEVFNIAESEPVSFVFTTIFSITIIFLKPFIFIFIYLCNRKLSYIHNFLYKFLNNKRYRFLILLIAFSLDMLCLIYLKDPLSLFLGLLFNYISFLILSKIIKI